ncbi:MAG: TRAP transporter small permease [Proteobacteria bacterium]|nr:TRAP transporter small permease [Pseudomonadota bacterium]
MIRYVRIVAFLSRVCGGVAAALIAVSIVVICDAIVERSMIGRPAIWQSEFVTYAIVAATFLGSSYVLLRRGHVFVDVVPHYLGPRARLTLAIVAGLLALGFCLIVLWTSFEWWWDRWLTGETKNSIWGPRLWIPSLSVPVGFGLLVLQYVADLWCLATRRDAPFGIEPAGDADGRGGRT